ncbi:MAG: FAD-dependent monooxygenase [Hyphomicrobiaceae bacterium]|nr:FAD-dependent monooxygenase [Hyphomicrobiaceae bacterium]
MRTESRTIYIIGAGIAGLTLALALAKFGATVVVLERAPGIHEEGAGLQISANARKILDHLGLSDALNTFAFEPAALDIVPFEAKKPLVSLMLGETIRERFGAPYTVMHRADLAGALYKACRRFANIDIQFGVEQVDVELHTRGASILFQDAAKQNINARPFAVIGADGVHSQIRREVMDGPDARYSGMVAWRTMVDIDPLSDLFSTTNSTLLWGPGFHAVLYPIFAHGKFNVALFTKIKKTQIDRGTVLQNPSLPRGLMRSPHFKAILENAAMGWTYWPLYGVSTNVWHRGPVGLIGDAAHGMVPFQAQGAVMGIEDAAVLASLLMSKPTALEALTEYAALRRPRVRKVQQISAWNGEIYHMSWPLTMGRDLVVWFQGPKAHLKRLAWIYGYDALHAPGRAEANPA